MIYKSARNPYCTPLQDPDRSVHDPEPLVLAMHRYTGAPSKPAIYPFAQVRFTRAPIWRMTLEDSTVVESFGLLEQ